MSAANDHALVEIDVDVEYSCRLLICALLWAISTTLSYIRRTTRWSTDGDRATNVRIQMSLHQRSGIRIQKMCGRRRSRCVFGFRRPATTFEVSGEVTRLLGVISTSRGRKTFKHIEKNLTLSLNSAVVSIHTCYVLSSTLRTISCGCPTTAVFTWAGLIRAYHCSRARDVGNEEHVLVVSFLAAPGKQCYKPSSTGAKISPRFHHASGTRYDGDLQKIWN